MSAPDTLTIVIKRRPLREPDIGMIDSLFESLKSGTESTLIPGYTVVGISKRNELEDSDES